MLVIGLIREPDGIRGVMLMDLKKILCTVALAQSMLIAPAFAFGKEKPIVVQRIFPKNIMQNI